MVGSRTTQVLLFAVTAGLVALFGVGAGNVGADVGTAAGKSAGVAVATSEPASALDRHTTEDACEPRQGDGAMVCVHGLPTPPAVAGMNPIHAPVPCVGTGKDGKRLVALYATAPGYPDRYASVVPKIRQWAGQASQEMWFASTGKTYGQKLRWATTAPSKGTCTPTVTRVVIPAASYQTATAVWEYLSEHRYQSPNAHYIVWVETPPADGICGLGQYSSDTRPSAAVNYNSVGVLYAWITPPCWENAVLHETLHTLGATSATAPHATKNGHCTDGLDVMCYADGTGVVITKKCTAPLYVRQPLWGGVDCGNDTYYNQAPAPGTYLASHWNVASSPFLQRTTPAPARPSVASASGPRNALPGTLFTLRSGARTAPAGGRPGSALWLAPAGCQVLHPASATTTASCSWLTDGVKAFKAVGTDKYGRLGARTVNVSVSKPANRQLTGTMSQSTRTARPGTRVYVMFTIRDSSSGRQVIGVPVQMWGYRQDTRNPSLWARGTTNCSGQVRLSYIQPAVSVGISGTSAYWPKRWDRWASTWVSVSRS